MHSSLYQAVSAARRDVAMLSWARHIGHCLQLIYRAVPRRAISYSLVVQRIRDLNHLFVPVDTLSVRVYLSFRALYTGFTSLMPRGGEGERGASRHYEADFILPRALSHYIITRCHPAARADP